MSPGEAAPRQVDYVVAGDNCPNMLAYNLDLLAGAAPASRLICYDWGYDQAWLGRLRRRHPEQLVVVPVGDVDPGNYTYYKVRSQADAVERFLRDGMVLMDTDVIIHRPVDAVFRDADWDVAVTWRPEYEFGRDRHGIGHWINAGVLFVNGSRVHAGRSFFRAWRRGCEDWFGRKDRWYQDQVELLTLYERCGPHLKTGPGQSGEVELGGVRVRCATLHYTDYNFLPWMRRPYAEYDPVRAHLFHFKNNWRRDCFNAVPARFRPALMRFIATPAGNRRAWKRLLGMLALIRLLPWRPR